MSESIQTVAPAPLDIEKPALLKTQHAQLLDDKTRRQGQHQRLGRISREGGNPWKCTPGSKKPARLQLQRQGQHQRRRRTNALAIHDPEIEHNHVPTVVKQNLKPKIERFRDPKQSGVRRLVLGRRRRVIHQKKKEGNKWQDDNSSSTKDDTDFQTEEKAKLKKLKQLIKSLDETTRELSKIVANNQNTKK